MMTTPTVGGPYDGRPPLSSKILRQLLGTWLVVVLPTLAANGVSYLVIAVLGGFALPLLGVRPPRWPWRQ